MTKRELSGRITSNFESQLEKQFNAYNFDESEGGRRTFSIHSSAKGHFEFEWSRTGHTIYSWDSTRHVNPTKEQTQKRNLAIELEKQTQELLDNIIIEQTALYNKIKSQK